MKLFCLAMCYIVKDDAAECSIQPISSPPRFPISLQSRSLLGCRFNPNQRPFHSSAVNTYSTTGPNGSVSEAPENALSVTEIRQLLDEGAVDYRDCFEKAELINRLRERRGKLHRIKHIHRGNFAIYLSWLNFSRQSTYVSRVFLPHRTRTLSFSTSLHDRPQRPSQRTSRTACRRSSRPAGLGAPKTAAR